MTEIDNILDKYYRECYDAYETANYKKANEALRGVKCGLSEAIKGIAKPLKIEDNGVIHFNYVIEHYKLDELFGLEEK